jgi:hypothetical protein
LFTARSIARNKSIAIERFIHKVDCAAVEGSLSNLIIKMGGDKNDRQFWVVNLKAAL